MTKTADLLVADGQTRRTLFWRVLIGACPNCGVRRYHDTHCILTFGYEMSRYIESKKL